jgi:S-adenosylmethionine-dependent methyltransferase
MDILQAFDVKASAWEAYTQTPLGRLREDLNWQYMMPHLPPPPARILDVGCGTGGVGLRLAQQGYQVDLLDFSPEMLAIAAQKARQQQLDHLLTFYPHAIETWQPSIHYDGVLCHTLLEYVVDVPSTLKRLVGWLKPNGLLSVVFVNAYAEPLTLALGKQQLHKAIQAIHQESGSADLFGVPRRLFTSQEIRAMLAAFPLQVLTEYGVRIIADYSTEATWKTDADHYQVLLQLETQLANQFPYQFIGRYGQIISQVS